MSLIPVLRYLLAFATTIMVASCDLVTAIGEDHASVIDKTGQWGSSTSSRRLLADVTVDDGWVVEGVRAYSTRHFWPGRDQAHVTVATLVSSGPNEGLWQAIPEGASTMPRADRLFYQWEVLYRLETGQDILDVRSEGQASQVIECSQQQIDLTYDAIRIAMNGLQSASGNLNSGYQGPAHLGPYSLLDQGVPYAKQATVGGQIVPVFGKNTVVVEPGSPDLLLYAPRPRQSNESTQEYYDAITDLLPDPPYTLLGVAYGVTHNSATRRPRMGCIPSDEWFVHEAGYHQADGGFQATPPPEDVLGETAVPSGGGATGFPPQWAPPADEFSPVWHPRLWDLHFWIAEGGAGRPIMTINVPQGQAGISLGEGGFFQPQTFE